ncbi:MAG TPA: 1-acyl-sn-glycerol-3-phosphate acyltransferase, partial [Dissulfurispiraceae bacterium]
RGEDAALMADEVGRKVAEAIRELADGETPVRATDNLELDLGFDSLAKVELITSLERVFSISLPDAFITEVQTVGDIVSALRVSRGEESPGEAGAVSWKDIIRKEPLPRDTERISLSYGMIELAVVYGVLAGLKILFRLVFRLRVEGMENVPEKGPFVVTPNHASYLDGFVIAASIPFRMFRRFYFLGLKQFFTGAIKAQFARLAHVIPIDSETYLHKALLLSAYVLKRGMSLCVFPEGGRSFDGGVMPFKKGIGVLALELGVPVVPAYIDGTFRALPRDVKFPRPAGITVTFGKPITPSDTGVEKKAPDKYQAFADALRRKVLGLSDRPGK